jgi:hypothetical protein
MAGAESSFDGIGITSNAHGIHEARYPSRLRVLEVVTVLSLSRLRLSSREGLTDNESAPFSLRIRGTALFELDLLG